MHKVVRNFLCFPRGFLFETNINDEMKLEGKFLFTLNMNFKVDLNDQNILKLSKEIVNEGLI